MHCFYPLKSKTDLCLRTVFLLPPVGSTIFILFDLVFAWFVCSFFSELACLSYFYRKMRILAKVILVGLLTQVKITWQNRPITSLFPAMHPGLIITGEWALPTWGVGMLIFKLVCTKFTSESPWIKKMGGGLFI